MSSSVTPAVGGNVGPRAVVATGAAGEKVRFDPSKSATGSTRPVVGFILTVLVSGSGNFRPESVTGMVGIGTTAGGGAMNVGAGGGGSGAGIAAGIDGGAIVGAGVSAAGTGIGTIVGDGIGAAMTGIGIKGAGCIGTA